MKSLLPAVIVLALAGTCCAHPVPTVPTHVELADDLARKTVELVEVPDPEGDLAKCAADDVGCILAAAMEGTEPHVYCSGEWVSPTQILTANHCMGDDPHIGDDKLFAVETDVVPGEDGVVIGHRPAKLQARDEKHDLALLYVAGVVPAHGVATLALEDIVPGQDAFAMGAPLGLGWSFSAGTVSQIRYMDADSGALWYVQATTPISPGSSGGGLYDAWGRLIGVSKATAPRGENINIFVHRDDIRAFLAAAKVGA